MALVHVDYPHSWTNVSGEIGHVEIKQGTFKAAFKLRPSYYEFPQEIVSELNTSLVKYHFSSFFQALNSGVCRMVCSKGERVTIHPSLAGLLGFERNNFTANISESSEREIVEYYGPHLMDVRSAMYNIYIYSDLVSDTLVGDKYVPLLQTVPV